MPETARPYNHSHSSMPPPSSSNSSRLPLTLENAGLRRITACRLMGAPPELFIAHVDVTAKTIVVWSCEPIPYSAPLDGFPRLLSMSAKERRDFHIEDTGVHWGEVISLNIAGVKAAARNPSESSAAAGRAWAVFGKSVRAMREKAKLRQTDVEGLSERELRRIEKGEVAARKPAQEAIASALGLSLKEFMVRAWSPAVSLRK